MGKKSDPVFEQRTFTSRQVERVDDTVFEHPFGGFVAIPGFSYRFLDGFGASILPETTEVLAEHRLYPKQYRTWLPLQRTNLNLALGLPKWAGSGDTNYAGMFGTYNLGQAPLTLSDFLTEDPSIRERRRRNFIPDPIPIPVSTLRVTEPMQATHARIRISTRYLSDFNRYYDVSRLDCHYTTDGTAYSSDGIYPRNIFFVVHLDERWQEIREAAQKIWNKLKTDER